MNHRIPLLGANIIELSICYQHLSSRLNRALEPLNLNMTQMSLLTYFSRLQKNTPETISHLSNVMEMNQPMVTKAIKSMHAQGLIDRKPCQEDARITHLFINDVGLRSLEEAQMVCVPIISEAYQGLDHKELELLLGLLSKIKSQLCQPDRSCL